MTILDGLIGNAGPRFQQYFADEPLIERLRLLSREDMVDTKVKRKCYGLFGQWETLYSDTSGLHDIATLSRGFSRPRTASLSNNGETFNGRSWASGHSRNKSSSDAINATKSNSRYSSSMTGSSSSTPRNRKAFNLAKEEPKMLEAIASASVASTNLLNNLKRINNNQQRVSENQEAVRDVKICNSLRRQILEYIQLVESEQYIGSLLEANDKLVKAVRAYNITERGVDDDSDSEPEKVTSQRHSLAALQPDSNIGYGSSRVEKKKLRLQVRKVVRLSQIFLFANKLRM